MRASAAPNAETAVATPKSAPRITVYHETPAGALRTSLSNAEIVRTVADGNGRLWVDIDAHDTTVWLALAQTIGFHPLTIEDTLSPESRLKVEEYEDFLFVVCREAEFDQETPDLYDVASSNLYLFIGRTYLFTVHARPSRATRALAERLSAGPELMQRGIDYLAYAVLDAVTDLYFPLLDKVDHLIDLIETEIFGRLQTQETLEHVFSLKRTLLGLRRQQAPMREVLATMANRPTPYLTPATQVYFRDVYDHAVRQVESIESFRDLLNGALEIHFSVLSNRTNEIMKALAIVGTFLLPATWVASVYGMNFERMPMLDHPLGFVVALFAMVGISLVLVGYMKWKRWL